MRIFEDENNNFYPFGSWAYDAPRALRHCTILAISIGKFLRLSKSFKGVLWGTHGTPMGLPLCIHRFIVV